MKTHLDLFSGIGGFALAAKWNGLTTVGFCEIEPYAQKVLIEKFGAVVADANSEHGRRTKQSNATTGHGGWKESREAASGRGPALHSDIFSLNGADYAGVDLLTGGFPCQPFSCAGKRAGAADDRHLWPEMRRVIDEARPAWVLAENVSGIIGMELDAVLSDLENIGYACWPVVVPACAVDARHRRDRVWIVANANGRIIVPCIAQPNLRQVQGSNGGENGDVANTDNRGLQGKRTSGQQVVETRHGERQSESRRHGGWQQWPTEPELGRVAHGISNRSHRLKGLGNAIVPQVAAQIISMMIESEGQCA